MLKYLRNWDSFEANIIHRCPQILQLTNTESGTSKYHTHHSVKSSFLYKHTEELKRSRQCKSKQPLKNHTAQHSMANSAQLSIYIKNNSPAPFETAMDTTCLENTDVWGLKNNPAKWKWKKIFNGRGASLHLNLSLSDNSIVPALPNKFTYPSWKGDGHLNLICFCRLLKHTGHFGTTNWPFGPLAHQHRSPQPLA